jgi:4-amino-4-deoxy-L-arabinose transferase-like glycosyltransferase
MPDGDRRRRKTEPGGDDSSMIERRTDGIIPEGYEWIILLFIIATALALRVTMLIHTEVIAADGPGYLSQARLIQAKGMGAFFANITSLEFSLYPLFIYLVAPLTGNWETSGAIISLLFGMGLFVPVYLLTSETMGKGIALITLSFLAVHPDFIRYSVEVLKESTLYFFALLSLVLVFFGIARKKIWLFVLAGAVCWVTVLVRLFGIIMIPTIAAGILAAVIAAGWKPWEAARALALFLLPIPLVGLLGGIVLGINVPDMVAVLSSKVISSIHFSAAETYRERLYSFPLDRQTEWYVDLVTGHYLASCVADFFKNFRIGFFDPFFYLFLAGMYIDRKRLFSDPRRLFILVFCLVYLSLVFLRLYTSMLFTKRLIMEVVAVLIIWSGLAASYFYDRIKGIEHTWIKRTAGRFGKVLVVTGAAIWVIAAFIVFSRPFRADSLPYKTAGAQILALAGPGKVIVAPINHTLTVYYAQGEGTYFIPPDTTIDDRAKSSINFDTADFIIWDEAYGDPPEMITSMVREGRLVLLHTFRMDDHDAFIYRVVRR